MCDQVACHVRSGLCMDSVTEGQTCIRAEWVGAKVVRLFCVYVEHFFYSLVAGQHGQSSWWLFFLMLPWSSSPAAFRETTDTSVQICTNKSGALIWRKGRVSSRKWPRKQGAGWLRGCGFGFQRLLYYYITILSYNYITLLLYDCTIILPHFHSTIVPCYHTITRLDDYTTILLYYYTTRLPYYFATILLYYYTTIPWYYYTAILLYY